MSNHIQSKNIGAGLNKAFVAYCDEMLSFFMRKIQEDLVDLPEHVQEWSTGSFSYMEVRSTLCWSRAYLYQLEMIVMARKSSNANNKRQQTNYTFVRCELRKEDKDACKAWIDKNSKTMSSKVASLMGEGHKISISLSTEKDTFTASASGQESSNNYGLILTARHKDWFLAVSTLLYKHEEMFTEGIWSEGAEEDDGWS